MNMIKKINLFDRKIEADDFRYRNVKIVNSHNRKESFYEKSYIIYNINCK